jgi:acyl-CoA thioesterase-2
VGRGPRFPARDIRSGQGPTPIQRRCHLDSPFTQIVSLELIDDEHFVAPVAPERGDRTYGGQLLAQSLAAAQRTVDADRAVHSLHGYFLRAGDPDHPVDLAVDRVRDGRSFSSRAVSARQDGREVVRLIASFHVPEDGLEYSGSGMPEAPPPENVSLTYEQFTHDLRPDYGGVWSGDARALEVRYINPPTAPEGEAITEDQRMWLRIDGSLNDDPALHAAALAYMSDSTLVDHVMLPHGYRWQDARLEGASLDHAMWFHRAVRADEWLLFDQTVVATSGARGLVTARFYTAAGVLVATCSQEGLMRWPA